MGTEGTSWFGPERKADMSKNMHGPSEAEAPHFIDSIPGTCLCLGISSLTRWS